MKIVYIDESGKDKKSPFAVLCGISFDHNRMSKTKKDWLHFIKWLNKEGVRTSEMHTSQFFAGKGCWYTLKGDKRKKITEGVIHWINKRAHEFCVVAADKKIFTAKKDEKISVYKNIWFFLSTHLIFAFSKRYQGENGTKGDFIGIFDEGCVGSEFSDFILSDDANTLFKEYTGVKKCLIKLSDAPLSANSKHSSLIQIADFIVFFVRRKIELEYNMKEEYLGEKKDIDIFYKGLLKNKMQQRFIYKKAGRSNIEDIFYSTAPDFLKK
ncbi:MAG: DUF3800 domain-containing protein [Candidatus Komeilibacteria bacterium]|jgi:hypothetical protein|nr:DUF3800 domain-containing protein [Candidatus Komeilibacteria bacterium]MBT4447767.1 DUF3800 domain-containing protein [Candidatus Komeilibacteria bacterium]